MAEGIRIDELPPTTVGAQLDHVVPVMRDGLTNRLTLAQILTLGRIATALANGTDLNTITSDGVYVVTSNVNAPVSGGRWIVRVTVDPSSAGTLLQEAYLLTGSSGALAFTRISTAGVFGAWREAGGAIAGNLSVGGEFTYGKAKNISGTDLNALTVPGFYDGTNLANAPNSNPEWFYIEVQRHSLNDNYVHQRATALYHSNHATWVRNMVGGMWQPWRKVWDDGNLDPWAVQPIGVPIPVFEYIPGVPKPPTDRGYRYVLLSAGRTGSGGYNEGCLVDEVVTGSAPLIHASAWVSLAGSPLVGQQIRLINTERRFIRAGQPGAVQDDAMQDHTHWQPRDNVFGTGAGGTSTSFFQGSVNGSTGGVDNGRVANETRPRNIGAAYYMRIL